MLLGWLCPASCEARALATVPSPALQRAQREHEFQGHQSACEHLDEVDIEVWRIEPDTRAGHDARLDAIAGAAPMMDQRLTVGIDDEIVMEARQAEIALQLDTVVALFCAWREHLD